MSKRNIVFLVFMLVVGFSVVSAAIVVNGNINLSFDETGFVEDVVFTKSSTSDGTASISPNEKNINFETKKLENVNDTAVLDFEIANKNTQYNANVEVRCGLKSNFSSFDEYISITTNLTSPFELVSGERKTGKLTIKLKKVYTGDDIAPEVLCTLGAMPVERESVGKKYEVLYQAPDLNGADPVLDEGGRLVPVTIADNGAVTYANKEEKWYDYSTEVKEWANAVILVDNPSQTYNVGSTIVESDIESYFVWIPRYRYQIFDEGGYTGTQAKLSESNAKEIQIVFEGKDTAVSNGSKVGDWLTHPAFTNYDTNGIWVGKFETGYKGATSTSSAQVNTIDATKIIIKPNVYSWRSINVSNIFKTTLAYEENLNSHMMRNTEWGAVAYLTHSKYGINTEVRINNNSNLLTGYAANEKDASYSTTNNSQYNTATGYLASTTGNITGVYDMSGGAREYVAGYRANTPASSGFSASELTTYAAHLDAYNANSRENSYSYRILGDATGEMGPFYNDGNCRNNWYSDYSHFVDSSDPWFARGGPYDGGFLAGQFNFERYDGGTSISRSFRLALAFEN